MVLALYYAFVFLLGIAAGSFLNVCAARLPYEKSLLWPRSRCASCLQPILWHDNIPVVSYLLRRGRCRTCGARFSARYFLVELGTGLAFVGLFYLEAVRNCLGLPVIRENAAFAPGGVPPEAWCVFLHHAVLVCFLLAASLCDLQEMEIPLTVTMWGTLVGLLLAMLQPWPVPGPLPPSPPPGANAAVPPYPGTYPWPVWYPLPDWLPPGSWRLGLATGLAGALAGMAVLRAIRFLFSLGRGIEGLGVGDADLMMMAGAFVGWQPVLFAFLVGVFVGLFFALGQLAMRGGQMLPFGPSLAVGVVVTVLCWPGIAPGLQPALFEPALLGMLGAAAAVALLLVSFLLRLLG